MATELEPNNISNINNEENINEVIQQVSQLTVDNETPNQNLAETKSSSHDSIGSDSSEIFDSKQKKRLDKIIDNVLKNPKKSTQPNSFEEKYYAIAQKFVELQEQNKKHVLGSKDFEKTVNQLTKQRDQIQSEYAKALLVKAKLENLCRELQKQNKLVKEESLQRIEDEEKKRKEISNKFQGAIDEINQQVASNSEKNNSLIQENVQLTTKLKTLIEQYEVREQHIEKVLKHKDLELQLANAKLQQSELKVAELSERNKKEKTLYDAHCLELNKKCEFHQDAENQLKSQLTLYTQKYEEFQTTLSKSNQVFESFRTEMDKMTKKIKKLEQETAQWKNKWETCDNTLKKVLQQREELEDKSKKNQTRADMMEKISRSLQEERNLLKQQIKEMEEKLNKTTIDDQAFIEIEKIEPEKVDKENEPQIVSKNEEKIEESS